MKPESIDKKKKPSTPKRRLFYLHSWLGFNLAFIMSVVLLTGTIAVIADEIDWLVQPPMRVSPDGERVSWGAMEAAARAAAPEDALIQLMQGEGDHFAHRAMFARPGGGNYYLNVNQWTGEVTGTTPSLTVQRFFRDLHRYLFMPSSISLPIVCAMGFVLLVSLYTGLKTAGRLRTVAVRIRFNKGTRVVIGDFHRAAGVWSIWFLVLIAVTGIWYLVEFGGAILGKRFEPPRTALTSERLEELGDVLPMVGADVFIARARAAIPDWEPTRIIYPTRPGAAIIVFGRWKDPIVRPRANRVSLDPADGSVLQVVRSNSSGVLAYVNDLADPLHFGDMGRLLSVKLVWFVFGAVLTSLSLTGVWLTYRRLQRVSTTAAQIATLPILLATLWSGYLYVNRYLDSGHDDAPHIAARATAGPFHVELRHADERNRPQAVSLHISHLEGRPLVREAVLHDAAGKSYALSPRFFGPSAIFHGELPEGADVLRQAVSIGIMDWSGVWHTAEIRMLCRELPHLSQTRCLHDPRQNVSMR